MDHKGPLQFVSWQRPLEKGSNRILGRAEILHKGIKMSTVLQYIKDVYKHQPENMIKDQKFLETHAEGYPTKVYQKMKMPMMSERESLVQNTITKLSGEYEGRYMWIQ